MKMRSRLVSAFAGTALGAMLLAAAPMCPAAASTSRSTTPPSRTAISRSRSWPRRRRPTTPRRRSTRRTSTTRDQKIDVLTKKLESLGQDVSRLETERGNLGGELETAKKRMEDLRKAQAQAEARASQFRKLVAQFKQLTDAGKLQVELRENRMIVRLGDQILFDPGKTELKKEGEDALRQVTDVLKEIPNRNFQVAGHTDNIPIKSKRFRSNWDLSTARAVEVVNFMIASGMEPKRLSAAGYADQSPVAAQRHDGEQGQEPAHRDHAGAEPGRPAADRRGAQGEPGRRARAATPAPNKS